VISPAHKAAYTGSTVTLKCPGEGPVNWVRLRGNDSLLHRVMVPALLKLDRVKEEDSGVYICWGKDGDGVPFQASSVLKIGGR